MQTIFYKSLLTLLQYCFCFMLWFFLARRPVGSAFLDQEPTSAALEDTVLTTSPPGKSRISVLQDEKIYGDGWWWLAAHNTNLFNTTELYTYKGLRC